MIDEITNLARDMNSAEGKQRILEWYQKWKLLDGNLDGRMRALVLEQAREIESREKEELERETSQSIQPPCMPGVPIPFDDPDSPRPLSSGGIPRDQTMAWRDQFIGIVPAGRAAKR